MKKILLLSDTHGVLDDFILKHAASADQIWHAGDVGGNQVYEKLSALGKPLCMVYGNIDGQEIRKNAPEQAYFTVEGLRILMIHIGGYPGKYPAVIKAMLKARKPDLFICGHSHILKVIFDKQLNLLHLNPGAAGLEGFHQKRTMLRFTLDPVSRISNMEVIETDKKRMEV